MKYRTGTLVKRGSNFYVRWKIDGKPSVKVLRDNNGQAITSRREAEEAKAKFMAPLALADEAESMAALASKADTLQAAVDKMSPPLLLAHAWAEYMRSPNRPDTGPDTLAVYEGQFGQFKDWVETTHPDAKALRDVGHDIAEEYAGHLNHGRLSPNTFNKHVRVLELVFRILKRKARLEENPWESIQRKKLETVSRRELTLEELKKVCVNAAGELRVLFALGVYTGLRLKDCATLRWGEIDVARNVIRRVPSKTARRNPRPVIIPIHSALKSILDETPQEKRVELLMPELGVEYVSGGAGKKRVTDRIMGHFASQGIRIHKPGTGSDSKGGKRAVIEVGFHSLRHTFVSLCRESNAPLAVVESIVGHSNPAMTRHYTHVGELAAGQAVAALPAVIGDAANVEVKPDAAKILREVKSIVESMTGKTWKARKAAIVALLKTVAEDGQPATHARG
jgi:integrase